MNLKTIFNGNKELIHFIFVLIRNGKSKYNIFIVSYRIFKPIHTSCNLVGHEIQIQSLGDKLAVYLNCTPDDLFF